MIGDSCNRRRKRFKNCRGQNEKLMKKVVITDYFKIQRLEQKF